MNRRWVNKNAFLFKFVLQKVNHRINVRIHLLNINRPLLSRDYGSKHTYLLGLGDKVIDLDQILKTKKERLKYLQDQQFNYRYSFNQTKKNKKLKLNVEIIVPRIFG